MQKLTKAQEQALRWLPADGSWISKAGQMSQALNSLELYTKPKFCVSHWGNFGPKGGRVLRWRLTTDGITFLTQLTATEKTNAQINNLNQN